MTTATEKLPWDASLFALVGASLGLATLLVLNGIEYFVDQPFFEGVGVALVGAAVTVASLLAALLASILLAAAIGHAAARHDPDGAPTRGAVAGAAGHVTLLLAHVVVLVVGFALLGTLGPDRELLGEGGVVSTRLLGHLLLGLGPATLAGWGAGWLRGAEERDRRREGGGGTGA